MAGIRTSVKRQSAHADRNSPRKLIRRWPRRFCLGGARRKKPFL